MEQWIVYEAAARGIARARSGQDRAPTDTEREWAKAAVDAAAEFLPTGEQRFGPGSPVIG